MGVECSDLSLERVSENALTFLGYCQLYETAGLGDRELLSFRGLKCHLVIERGIKELRKLMKVQGFPYPNEEEIAASFWQESSAYSLVYNKEGPEICINAYVSDKRYQEYLTWLPSLGFENTKFRASASFVGLGGGLNGVTEDKFLSGKLYVGDGFEIQALRLRLPAHG